MNINPHPIYSSLWSQNLNKRLQLLVLLLVLGVVFAPSAFAEIKIGFVNAAQVLEHAPQAKAAGDMLDKEFAKREAELVVSQKHLKTVEEELLRDGSELDDDQRTSLEREVVARRREIKRAQDDFREDFNLRRNQELKKLQKEIRKVILEMAKEDKFDLIVSDGVVYANKSVDVTKSVLKRLGELLTAKPSP